MTYLPKELAFPNISKFSDLFGSTEDRQDYEFADKSVISNWIHHSPKHRSEYRKPSDMVLKFVRDHMLPVDYDSIYFQAVNRGDNQTLITAQYNQIIGSRWLAIVETDTMPKD